MPDFLCKDAYRVGARQGGAIVAKLEATLDAACRRVKFPIGNLGEVACTLFARERFDAASARNAGALNRSRANSVHATSPRFPIGNLTRRHAASSVASNFATIAPPWRSPTR